MIINSIFYNTENPLGVDDNIPADGGLYLVGNANVNPHTGEEFYSIKVGMGINLRDRVSKYRTENPFLFHIDYITVKPPRWSHSTRDTKALRKQYKENIHLFEQFCHNAMFQKNFVRMNGTREWFVVDKQTYLEICEKKFRYFFGNTIDNSQMLCYNKDTSKRNELKGE